MNEYPLVTINILSFNRKDELRNTLTKVYEQDYKNIEVIVVDNASADGSSEMVKKEFPGIQVIQLEKNIGIAGWNEGFKVAKGEYVLVLDDDSYPKTKTIQDCLNLTKIDPLVGVVACDVYNRRDNRLFSEFIHQDSITSFVGCGALINSNIFRIIGFFDTDLFLYEHEVEFSMRVIDSGYKLVFSKNSLVIHNTSPQNRNIKNTVDRRRIYFSTKNLIYILLSKFPFKIISFRLFRIIIGRSFLGLKVRSLKEVLFGTYDGITLYLKKRNDRKVLKESTQHYFRLGKFAGGFFGQEGMLR